MSDPIGRLAKLYANITGTFASPVWLEVKKIGDVDVENSAATSERNTRESGNTKTVVGNAKFGLKFEYEKRIGTDAVYAALRKSKAKCETLDMLALDESITTVGAEGIRGPFKVTSMSRKEPINDQIIRSFEMMEGYKYESGAIVDTVAVEVTSSGLEEIDFDA